MEISSVGKSYQRKWKSQARERVIKGNGNGGPTSLKRPREGQLRASPECKKMKKRRSGVSQAELNQLSLSPAKLDYLRVEGEGSFELGQGNGVDKNANLIAEFRDVLDCKLIDLGSKGHPFTWCNRQFGPLCIEEKIDRFFCNEEWRTEFHDDVATNLIHWESDYCPVMMEVRERQQSLVYERRNFNRIYCEDMWSRYEECQNIVKYEWLQWHITTEINPVLRFKTIGKRSLAQMKWWSKEEFGGRDKKLKELMRKLKRAKESNLQYENGNEIRHIER
ncbi:hypothetical protein WN943_006687 [Citrus x changshan-huyou]